MKKVIKSSKPRMSQTLKSTGIAGVITILAGCSSTPEPHPEIVALEDRYAFILGQEYAGQEADSELDDALMAITAGREAYYEDNETDLDHYLFVADKSLDIAEARIELHEINLAIDSTSDRHSDLVLEAREREKEDAEFRARVAEARADSREAQLLLQQQALTEQEQELEQKETQLNQVERELTEKEKELAETEENLQAIELQANLLAAELSEVTTRESERGTILVLNDIVFDYDSAKLNEGSFRAIEEIAEFISEQNPETVTIEGHTDSVGSDAYNDQLSLERAESVERALVREGVASNKMQIAGYGEEFPVASNDSAEGRQLNRRVEIIIDDQAGSPLANR